MPKISKILLLAVSVVLVLVVFLGVNWRGVRAASATAGQDGAYRQINVYSDVLQKIQDDYVTQPNIPEVTNGALRGLLESLDADSSYLTASDYKAYKADEGGKTAQVGINASKRYGYAIVVSVVPGSPADKAGLVDNDILEAIDGKDTRNISLAMIQRLLQGAPGSTLTVGVVRPSKPEPDKISMTRAIITEPPVKEDQYENASILYLKPATIDRAHVDEIQARLKQMPKSGNKKVLLDLRDVASGDMSEGIRLANLFLNGQMIGSLEGQKFPKQVFWSDAAKSVSPNAPLIVLVNRGTAGAAELVAGAILDDKRGDVVGEKTFGEGGQQKTFELADGGALILTIAKYESPSGKKLQDEGVTPNVPITAPAEEQADVTDESLPQGPAPAAAPATAPTTALPKKPSVQVDEPLTKALDLLKAKPA
ncbi:MAG TPA: S41 family peptidase [Acidobacteriaceae bacterium]